MPRISPFALSYLRKRTTQLMLDECVIYRPTDPALNRTTGAATRSEGIVLYTGVCRFWEVPGGNQTLMGDEQVMMASTFVSVPWDASAQFRHSDMITATKVADVRLLGRVFQIHGTVHAGGLRSSRKFEIITVDSSNKDNW